jgi:hypothetical protein
VLNRSILAEDIPEGLHAWNDFGASHWAYADFTEAICTHDFTRKAESINEMWTEIVEDGINAPYNQ